MKILLFRSALIIYSALIVTILIGQTSHGINIEVGENDISFELPLSLNEKSFQKNTNINCSSNFLNNLRYICTSDTGLPNYHFRIIIKSYKTKQNMTFEEAYSEMESFFYPIIIDDSLIVSNISINGTNGYIGFGDDSNGNPSPWHRVAYYINYYDECIIQTDFPSEWITLVLKNFTVTN